MATVAESGLFPPLIDTYIPAQTVDDITQQGGFLVKFNISPYNDSGLIEEYHISITRQSNYTSLLNKTIYPMGIYVVKKGEIAENGDVILHIPFSKLAASQFAYNEYYKIQVRLSKDAVSHDMDGIGLSTYLADEANLMKFSEWSTVCLGRMIAPSKILLDANGEALINTPAIEIDSSNLIISGEYKKIDPINSGASTPSMRYFSKDSSITNAQNDKEYLVQYKVIIKQQDELVYNIVFESPNIDININDKKSIYYKIPYYFENGNYQIEIDYMTANLYQNTVTFSFSINTSKNQWSEQSKVSQSLAVDSVIGKVNITFLPSGNASILPQNAIFNIRRASDQDNFQYWETMWTKEVLNESTTSLTFDDFTIESGVLYNYEVTFKDPTNNETYYIVNQNIISIFDHAFLTGEGTQLCVKFNPNITNYKVNVSDNVTTTIGGKQPYITRNGNMYYRTFSLTGTIAYEMDAEHQFATRSSMYGDYIDIYGTYFVNRFFNQRNDRITQRKFRELVMNYLYDDVPKLFRSTPEGNILVRITDVSLTPNQQLGRMIYDFSCTATEIGDCTIENFKLYQIQDFGD